MYQQKHLYGICCVVWILNIMKFILLLKSFLNVGATSIFLLLAQGFMNFCMCTIVVACLLLFLILHDRAFLFL